MNILYDYCTKQKYTDIEIILVDDKDRINIYAHKCILASKCTYFDKLFNFGMEKNQSTIILNVSNAQVARDIIYSLYDRVIYRSLCDPKYLFEYFKCRSFFCLDNDVKLLYNLKIRPDEFDLFMQIISEFDFVNDIQLLQSIKKNIPIDYDLDNFSVEFVNELLNTNNYFIVSSDLNGYIKKWNVQNGSQRINKLKTNSGEICSIAISPDNLTIASVDYNDIKIWNIQTDELLNTLRGHRSNVTCIDFSPDNLKLVSSSTDCTIKVWCTHQGLLLNTLTGHRQPIISVNVSLDNKKIVSGSYDDTIKIWDIDSGILLNTLIAHSECVTSVAFSPDSLKIVSASTDCSIRIWDTNSGVLLNKLMGHMDVIQRVRFSPDNTKIVSGGCDYTIKIWNANNGSVLNTIQDHSDVVNDVVFSPDGLTIASCSTDATIKIWNPNTGKLLNTLTDNTTPVLSVAFPNISPIDTKIRQYMEKLNQ